MAIILSGGLINFAYCQLGGFSFSPSLSNQKQQFINQDDKGEDRIALIVNEAAIGLQQFNQAKNQFEGLNDDNLNNRLINYFLLKDLQQKQSISVSDEQLKSAIKEVANRNGLSIAQLLQSVKQQTGATEKQYLAQIKNEIANQQLKEKMLSSNLQINQQAIDAQMTQNAIERNIPFSLLALVIPMPLGDAFVRSQKIDEIKQQISDLRQKNQSIQQIAIALNKENQAQYQVIDQVDFKKIPADFAQKLTTLSAGEILAEPIVYDGNLYFYAVDKNIDQSAINNFRNQISQLLINKQAEDAWQNQLQIVRDNSYIELRK